MATQKDNTPKKDPPRDPTIEEHRAAIARQGQELGTAIHSADAVATRTEAATAAEREAKEKLAHHQAVSAEAALIRSDWKKLCDDLAILRERLARGREQLRSIREQFEKKRAHTNGYWGGEGSNLQFLQVAQVVAAIQNAIPFAEQATKHVENLNREHLKKMRDFGAVHGLPKETLEGLSYEP